MVSTSITTIQIHDETKNQLDGRKENSKESYEEVILKLIDSAEKQKRADTALLIEGYKEMYKESLKITKEWSTADLDWD